MRVNALGIVFILAGVFLLYESVPKIFYLGIWGVEEKAKILSVSTFSKRKCNPRDLLCDLHITDRYRSFYRHELSVDGRTMYLVHKDDLSEKEIVKVVYSPENYEYIHLVGSPYRNMYVMFAGGLVSFLAGFFLLRGLLRGRRA